MPAGRWRQSEKPGNRALPSYLQDSNAPLYPRTEAEWEWSSACALIGRPGSCSISDPELHTGIRTARLRESRIRREKPRAGRSACPGRWSAPPTTLRPCATSFTIRPMSKSALFTTYSRTPAANAFRTELPSESMLSIRTAVSGANSRICLVASIPSTNGIARSITTTRGLSCRTSWTASRPLLASPTTQTAGSSSSSRRRPLRRSA